MKVSSSNLVARNPRAWSDMMRPKNLFIRLAVLVAGITLVASCDSRLPTAESVALNGGGTGTSGSTTNNKNSKAPTIVIDSPTTGSLVNVGDSILVTVRLH